MLLPAAAAAAAQHTSSTQAVAAAAAARGATSYQAHILHIMPGYGYGCGGPGAGNCRECGGQGFRGGSDSFDDFFECDKGCRESQKRQDVFCHMCAKFGRASSRWAGSRVQCESCGEGCPLCAVLTRDGRQGRCHLSLALKIGEWLGTGRVLRSVAEC